MPGLTGLLPITTPLDLIAFIVAAGFYAYRAHLLQTRRTIAALPAGDRLAAVEATLTRFRIDTANLTSAEKLDLAIAQIRAQAQRFRVRSIVVCALALISAVISIASLPSREQNQRPAEAAQ